MLFGVAFRLVFVYCVGCVLALSPALRSFSLLHAPARARTRQLSRTIRAHVCQLSLCVRCRLPYIYVGRVKAGHDDPGAPKREAVQAMGRLGCTFAGGRDFKSFSSQDLRANLSCSAAYL